MSPTKFDMLPQDTTLINAVYDLISVKHIINIHLDNPSEFMINQYQLKKEKLITEIIDILKKY